MTPPKNIPLFLPTDSLAPLDVPPMHLGALSASKPHLHQITDSLTDRGHRVQPHFDDPSFQGALQALTWDAAIIDTLTVPRDTLPALRTAFPQLYLLCITGDAPLSRVEALRLGADAVLSAPTSTLELELKLHTLWRRKHQKHLWRINDWWLYGACLYHQGTVHPLSRMEFRLMEFMMTFPNVVHTREELLEAMLESSVFTGHQRSVDVMVYSLRKRIPLLPLCTLRGKGYLFAHP